MKINYSESVSSNLIDYKWKALFTVALSFIMGTMDHSITNISFPKMTEVFNAGITTIMWVSLAYTLVSTSLLLLLGKIGDTIGRKRIFVSGMLVFVVGLMLCSISQSIVQLILSRIIQAVGSSMFVSCGTAVIIEAFPSEERGKCLGYLGVSISIGLLSGPAIGGFLLKWLDWRSIYYMRIPICIIALLLSASLLKKDHLKADRKQIDYMGTLSSSLGIAISVFGLSQIKRLGFGSPFVYSLISIGILFLIAFVFIEKKAKDPVVDLSLFKDRKFTFGITCLFLVFASYPAFVLVIPFYLIQGMNFSPSMAGLLMTVPNLASIIFSPISGQLSDRYGSVWFSMLGILSIILSYFLMRNFDLQTQVIFMISVLFFFGAGNGLFQPPNNSTIMGAVPKSHYGTASAFIALQRQIGMAFGIAIVGTLFSIRMAIHQANLSKQGMSDVDISRLSIPPAFHDVLVMAIILGIAAIVLSAIPQKNAQGKINQE